MRFIADRTVVEDRDGTSRCAGGESDGLGLDPVQVPELQRSLVVIDIMGLAAVENNLTLTAERSLPRLAPLWHILIDRVCKRLLTVWASSGWGPREPVEDGLSDRWHAGLWRRSPDSFFPSRCLEAAGLAEGVGDTETSLH